MEIKIITGLSGAGKSTVIDKLEDMGFYCVDNLPPQLLVKFIELCEGAPSVDKLGIVIDIRGRAFFDDLSKIIKKIRNKHKDVKVLYLEAEDRIIVQRFKETRRAHPLSDSESMIEAVKKEREITNFLKELADKTIDTSNLKTRELETLLLRIFDRSSRSDYFKVVFTSFGFKNGIPLHSDIVFDVRFIENPYYEKELKELTGQDEKVKNFVFSQEKSKNFYKKLTNLLDVYLDEFKKEGRGTVVISIGCTGGKHRSVAYVEKLVKKYSLEDYNVEMVHRDKDK